MYGTLSITCWLLRKYFTGLTDVLQGGGGEGHHSEATGRITFRAFYLNYMMMSYTHTVPVSQRVRCFFQLEILLVFSLFSTFIFFRWKEGNRLSRACVERHPTVLPHTDGTSGKVNFLSGLPLNQFSRVLTSSMWRRARQMTSLFSRFSYRNFSEL